jgi:hypothetical protein
VGYNHSVRDIHATNTHKRKATTSLSDDGFALLAHGLLAWPPSRLSAQRALQSPWFTGGKGSSSSSSSSSSSERLDAATIEALARAASWRARPYGR